MRDRNTSEIRVLNNPVLYAVELAHGSKYIRLITPNGTRRISRRDALHAITETTRCRDCQGTNSWCEACEYIDNPLRIHARRVYLDGIEHGAILDC